MAKPIVENDKIVSLTYVLRNQHDEIREYCDLPVAYLHGSGSELFPKIEQALEGHTIGDRVTVELTPEDGFGEHDPRLTFTDDIEKVPPEIRHIGAELEAQNDKGETRLFYVTKIEDGKLTVDCNHPLAGQTTRFEVTITDIRDPTMAELQNGKPQGGPIPTIQ